MDKQETENHLIKQMKEIFQLYGVVLTPHPPKEGPVDFVEVMTKTQEKIEELNQQAEEVTKKMGMSAEELEAYSKNPKNFTPEQWELLERVRQECELFKTRTIESLNQAAADVERALRQVQPTEKEQAPPTKQPRKGVKKSQWLQS